MARPDDSTKFFVGQLIHHRRFGYRGVIIGVDARFSLTEEWYQEVASSRPPKDAPWYHVLVHDAEHVTYVAERNLEPDLVGEPIRHPLIGSVLGPFGDGRYRDLTTVH